MKPFLLFLISVYQNIVSPLLHTVASQFIVMPGCRYYPSCSRYAYGAIERYGALRGAAKGLKRLFSCWSKQIGGYDPVR